LTSRQPINLRNDQAVAFGKRIKDAGTVPGGRIFRNRRLCFKAVRSLSFLSSLTGTTFANAEGILPAWFEARRAGRAATGRSRLGLQPFTHQIMDVKPRRVRINIGQPARDANGGKFRLNFVGQIMHRMNALLVTMP
jgi:hypothetical protein